MVSHCRTIRSLSCWEFILFILLLFQNSSGADAVVYITGGPCVCLTICLELLNYILFTLHGQFRCLSLTLHRTNPGIW